MSERDRIARIADMVAARCGAARAGDVLVLPMTDEYRVRFWALDETKRKNASGHTFGSRADLSPGLADEEIAARCDAACVSLISMIGTEPMAGFRPANRMDDYGN